jgi:hypothetical protein
MNCNTLYLTLEKYNAGTNGTHISKKKRRTILFLLDVKNIEIATNSVITMEDTTLISKKDLTG